MSRTLARLMPEGSRASLTRIMTVLAAIEDGEIGGGAGSEVGGVVETTNGGPDTGSTKGDAHMVVVGHPHVRKHAWTEFWIGIPSTIRDIAVPAGIVIE